MANKNTKTAAQAVNATANTATEAVAQQEQAQAQQPEQMAAPEQTVELTEEQKQQIEASKQEEQAPEQEQKKRNGGGQSYAERQARMYAKVKQIEIPRGTSALEIVGDAWKTEGTANGSTAKLKVAGSAYKNGNFVKVEGAQANFDTGVINVKDGLFEVQAVHTNSVQRNGAAQADVTYLYELEGHEEPISEATLTAYVTRVLS